MFADGPVPEKLSLRQLILSFITMFEMFGCPNEEIRYRLGKWKKCHGDDTETAHDLGVKPCAISKMIERLIDCYKKHKKQLFGKKQKPHPG